MKLSISISNFSWPVPVGEISPKVSRLARMADDAGIDSLWVMDHFFQIQLTGLPAGWIWRSCGGESASFSPPPTRTKPPQPCLTCRPSHPSARAADASLAGGRPGARDGRGRADGMPR
jgi:hypothetical protein